MKDFSEMRIQTQYRTAGCIAARSTCSNSPGACNKLQKAQQHWPPKAREQALVNLYTTPGSRCSPLRAKRWLQKLRTALCVKGLWIPSTDNSEFCIAPVHSQQIGHFLWREPGTSQVNTTPWAGVFLGGKTIVSDSITASVSWKYSQMKPKLRLHPMGAQTQCQTNKTKTKLDLGFIW